MSDKEHQTLSETKLPPVCLRVGWSIANTSNIMLIEEMQEAKHMRKVYSHYIASTEQSAFSISETAMKQQRLITLSNPSQERNMQHFKLWIKTWIHFPQKTDQTPPEVVGLLQGWRKTADLHPVIMGKWQEDTKVSSFTTLSYSLTISTTQATAAFRRV